jgi:superfamily II DNA or RNA helicase
MTKQELQNKLQEETLTIIDNQYNVGVDIVTGGSKTLLGIKHMAKQYVKGCKFLIVAPKKSIFEEWKKEAKNHGYDYLLSSMQFSTYIGLGKNPYYFLWIYLDECHSLKYTHCVWLDMYLLSGGKILGLSGTFPTKGEKHDMCRTYCRKIYEVNLDHAIESGLLNNYRIFVHMLQISDKAKFENLSSKGKRWYSTETKDYFYRTAQIEEEENYQRQSVLRIHRMKSMQRYPTKVEYTKKILNKIDCKSLIFATSKEQAEELSKHTYHSGNKKEVNEKTLDNFNEGLFYTLACVDQISEGRNIKNLQVIVILHAYANDKQARQKIGRALRLNPDQLATIHILCYENTIDLQWVRSALKSFDQSKIKIYRP